MKLSIVILNYNTKELTLDCIKSIEKYPFSGTFEVLLVDNGSSDETGELIKKFKPKNFELRYIENKKNVGFAKGNNVGIRKAKGEYILLLNSDTKVTKNALNRLIDFSSQTHDAGVVASKLLNSDLSAQDSVFRVPTLARAFRQYILGTEKILDKHTPSGKKPVEVEVVVGAAFLITPSARKKVGLLDERYFMYFEDFDYCRKVRRAGLKVYYLPSVEIIHIHGASGKTSGEQMKRLVAASKIYHGIRHYLIQFMIKTGRVLYAGKV